jgi:hypothetical protein
MPLLVRVLQPDSGARQRTQVGSVPTIVSQISPSSTRSIAARFHRHDRGHDDCARLLACVVAYVVLTRNRALRGEPRDDIIVPGEDSRRPGHRLSM